MKRLFLLTLLLALFLSGMSQSLDLQKIMQGEDFVGYWPENIYWSPASDKIYFQWNPDKDIILHWYYYDLTSKKIHKLTTDELKKRIPQDYDRHGNLIVYAKYGDIFLYNLQTHQTKQITFTTDYETNPRFNFKGDKILFEKDNNLFAWNISSGTIEQLTNFVKHASDRKKPSAQEQWLINENLALFKTLRYDQQKSQAQEQLRKKLAPHYPRAIAINQARIFNIQLSPDERFITFIKDIPPHTRYTTVPHFITKNGFIYNEQSRAKVGFPRDHFQLWIYDRKRDTVYQLDISHIDGIKDWPRPYRGHLTGLRGLTYSRIKWSDDGKLALLLVRSQDNKDRWFLILDLEKGLPKVINRQTDTAWIGGPGISEWWAGGNFGWVPGQHKVWFQWERDGYSHLYVYDLSTGKTRQLTHGNWEVYKVWPTEKYWYLLTNKDDPGQRQLYRMPIRGGKMIKMTHRTGNNEIYFSPDKKYIAIRYSYSNRPWELYLKPNNPQDTARRITHSTTPEFEAYPWRDPQIITFTARDGAKVHARLYLPADSVKNNAAIIFVHGAGYLQNAHRWWSYYYREFMFHNLLVDKGFTVMDIDYRGSAGYGRDWRTAIYRHMGGKDLDDQVDGARWIVKKYGIDPHRIGIYGGSYGGFITLMAMFKYPDVFCCGAALRAVTNWANYNHGYTSNILNVPLYDSTAYRISSPIYYASGFKGKLLILHGMIDDNVHYQDVVQLTQRLIELHKTGWTITPYPMERHSFKHADAWYDEYRRIYEFFMQNLVNNKN